MSGYRRIFFQKSVPGLGLFGISELRVTEDAPLLHGWVTRPYARYWEMGDKSLEEVALEYDAIASSEVADAFLGTHEGSPAFLMETYLPSSHPVRHHYAVEPGDRGMHLLVGPPVTRRSGFTWAVFCTVLDFIFFELSARRVVVEPDADNHKIHRLNHRAGFKTKKLIELPTKRARLELCTAADYRSALSGGLHE